MAVNWTWKCKLGKVKIHRVRKDKEGNVLIDKKFDVQIYCGDNCLAVFLYEWKENKENLYNFWHWLDSTKDVDKIIKKNDKLFLADEIVKAEINTFYQRSASLIKLFTRLGIKTTCYYKEIK